MAETGLAVLRLGMKVGVVIVFGEVGWAEGVRGLAARELSQAAVQLGPWAAAAAAVGPRSSAAGGTSAGGFPVGGWVGIWRVVVSPSGLIPPFADAQ